MKKFLLFALAALLVLAMSVIAFAEEEEEASGITAEDLNASENPGVEFEVIESSGTSVTFDVQVKSGYMVDDAKLNDGNVAVPDVYLAKVNPSTGVQTMTKIAKNAEGYYKVAKFTVGDDRIVVDHVTPIAITIDGKNTKDDKLTIYPDGHTYIFKNFANNGTIEFVNCKTDYTKVLDGAYVDDFNHIIHMSEETSDVPYYSYFPDVQITGTFTNNGTIKVRFGIGQNGADRNMTINLTPNGAAGNFVNNGKILLPARAQISVNTFTNNGYIEVTHGVHVSNVASAFTVLAAKGFINNGEIYTEHGGLNIGNGDQKTDLINNGKITFASTITITGNLKNEATGELLGIFTTYKNEINSNTVNCKAKLNLSELFDAKDNVNSHYNKGLINIDLDGTSNEAFVFHGIFTNYTNLTIKGNGIDIGHYGKFINMQGAEYTYLSVEGTDGGAEYCIECDDWDYIEVEGEPQVEDAIIPLGIENHGTISMTGFYLYNDGKIQNYSDMLISFKYTGSSDRANMSWEWINDIKHITKDGRIFNYADAVLTFGPGRVSFTYMKNDGVIDLLSGSTLIVGQGSDSVWIYKYWFPKDDYEAETQNWFGTYELDNKGVINVNSGTKIFNFDTFNVSGEVNVALGGIVVNFHHFNIAKTGIVVNEGSVKNGDDSSFKFDEDRQFVADAMEYLMIINGQLINKNSLLNNTGCNIRIEKTGKLDNTEGSIVNKGLIVNVGEFTSTVEGIDNQFAIHGYEVQYTNKASECTCDEHQTAAPADETKAPETKAPETKAPETKAPEAKKPAETQKASKTPAAQTSDIAVAGLAVLATLALGGAVVAKKIR